MTGIELYSTTAASNNSTPPNGWPEGQAPSTVNDCARQMMASIRTWYEDAQWIKWGDTTVYVATTQFKIAGSDVTSRYTVGRRVKAVGSSTGTIYGTITVSAFSTDTTVTVSWDSGSLSNETLTISIGIITLTNGAGVATAPFIDSTALLKGSGDATKLLKIEVDGITTATTRTWTAPDSDLTVVGIATTQTLTNKTLTDSTTFIADDGDATKKLAFQCSGITTSTTRTITIPDRSGTMATTTGTLTSGNLTKFDSSGNVIDAGLTVTKGSVLTKNPYAVNSSTQQAHGLSSIPNLVLVYLENLSTELGYSAGDRVLINGGVMGGAGANAEVTINADATNVNVTLGDAVPYVGQKTTGGFGSQITAAKWKLIATPILI